MNNLVDYSSDSDSDNEAPVKPGNRVAALQRQVDELTRKLEEMQKLITSDALRILALERAQGTQNDETDKKPTRGTKRPASPPMFAESAGGGSSAYPCPGFGNLLGVCTGSTQNKKTGVIYKFCYSCQKTRKNTVLRPCERCHGEQYYDPAKFKCCWHCGGSKKRKN